MVDGCVFIRGQTIDPLVIAFQRLFITSALDTVRRLKKINNKKGEEKEGG